MEGDKGLPVEKAAQENFLEMDEEGKPTI